MKPILGMIGVSMFVAISFPAAAQNTDSGQGQATQQAAPDSGGASKPGMAGKQGSKAGESPTVAVGQGAATKVPGGLAPAGTADEMSAMDKAKQQDTSGVKGLPGSKSGPTQTKTSK